MQARSQMAAEVVNVATRFDHFWRERLEAHALRKMQNVRQQSPLPHRTAASVSAVHERRIAWLASLLKHCICLVVVM